MTNRIPANRVVELTKPVIVASEGGGHGHPITIIPILDGDAIAGLEIRCQCGSHALVDCVYDELDSDEAPE